ncbi:MAG: S24/S26 family peptidase [Kiritimatiellae bacterium]|nr:S24/S26 family peptidase [Kiritimatiellia bacterium]
MTGAPQHEARGTERAEIGRLLADLLGNGTAVRIRVTGRSMAPFLRGGEVLTVRPVEPSLLRVGDLVMFGRGGPGEALVHRVVLAGRDRDGSVRLRTKGDGLRGLDEPVAGCRVLGKVCVIERGVAGKGTVRIDLASRAARARGWWIACRGLVSALARKACAVLLGRKHVVQDASLPAEERAHAAGVADEGNLAG